MSKVALVRCESYDYDEVKKAAQRGVQLLGGPSAFAGAGEKILLKPNWLAPEPPERCVTTHPMVFRAVCEIFKDAGAKLSYGDSPGFGNPETAAKRTGFADVAEKLGIQLADFHSGREIFFNGAIQNKKFTIAHGVLESDGLISLPKLKTHGHSRMTGCIKNQLGCIPGILKAEFHVRLPDAIDFAKMLVDLNLLLKPRLYIMDGIYGMEGNGPRGGNPKKMNVLLFSADPVALDATVCRLIDLDPEFVPAIKAGRAAGLGTYLKEEVELLGDSMESFRAPEFDVKREPVRPFMVNGGLRFLQNAVVPRPYIVESKCVKCGICTRMCPVRPKALDWQNGDTSRPPVYRYDKCIRCYCCQELCPESAILLKVPLLNRLFGGTGRHKKIS